MKNMYGTSLLVASVLTAGGFTSMAMAQDECSTAITAVIGPNAFNTTTATTSPEAVDDTQCAGTFLNWGAANKDVWFVFQAPDTGYLNLNTCFAGSFDTSVVVYTGSCGALTQIACNGDGNGLNGCQEYYSRVPQIETTAGTNYYIRIGGYTPASGISESGTGSLALNFEAVLEGCLGATGDCGTPHATGGCDDAVCCSAVCAFDNSCCDASWTADCVTYAVDLCGLFVYSCTGANPAVANDCATSATVLTSDTFRDIDLNGCNTDGPNHDGVADCQGSGNDVILNDVWYRVQAQANGIMVVQTCVVNGGPATTFDSKIAVYDMGTNFSTFDYNSLPDALVDCNDAYEACFAAGGIDPSYLEAATLAGNWYLIRVGTFDTPGTARVTFNFPEPCSLPAPTSNEAEACGDDSNGGCNAGGPVESITLGAKVQGTFWVEDDGAGGLLRDLDWYQIDVTSDKDVTVSVFSNSFAVSAVYGGDITAPNCTGITPVGAGAGACPNTNSYCLSPGSYFIVVGMDFAMGATPCGSSSGLNNYVLEVTGVDGSCPTIVGTTCTSPGADTAWSNNEAPPAGTNNLNGVVACAVNTAFPDCALSGTGRNRFARPFAAGQIGGEINCFEVGFFSVVRDVNATNTACALYLSDLPLPATVYICRDTDGANPRNIIETAGDGNDLEVLSTRSVLVPGMADTGAIDFDPPLCLDGVTGNIVVVLDIPSFLDPNPTVPEDSGYQMRAAGNVITGVTPNVFVRLSCADAAGQYVAANSLGAFNNQWYVSANGTFAGCASDCAGDFDGDGFVTAADLSTLLGSWGGPGGDIDGDGTTTAADLSALLGAWGACP
jgi:hypothetical protein